MAFPTVGTNKWLQSVKVANGTVQILNLRDFPAQSASNAHPGLLRGDCKEIIRQCACFRHPRATTDKYDGVDANGEPIPQSAYARCPKTANMTHVGICR